MIDSPPDITPAPSANQVTTTPQQQQEPLTQQQEPPTQQLQQQQQPQPRQLEPTTQQPEQQQPTEQPEQQSFPLEVQGSPKENNFNLELSFNSDELDFISSEPQQQQEPTTQQPEQQQSTEQPEQQSSPLEVQESPKENNFNLELSFDSDELDFINSGGQQQQQPQLQQQLYTGEQEESPTEREQLPVSEATLQNQAKSLSPKTAQPDSIVLSSSSTQIISQTDKIDQTSREPSPPLPFLLPEESLPSPSQEQPQSDSDADVHEYVVEEILDKRLDANGEVKLLVKWENYPSSHNTWEPLDNLRYCDEVMQKYEIKRAQRLAKLYGGLNLYGEGSSKMGGDTADKKDRRHKEYKVSEVIGLTEVKDQKYFLVNLQDDGGSAYIRSSLANKLFPCKVIDFYMKHITWKKPT